jgi:integrase
LEWKEVDRAAKVVRLDPSKTKTKKPASFASRRDGRDPRPRRRTASARFPIRFPSGRRAAGGQFRKSWTHACQAAALGHVLVHVLRRCTVRNLVQAGICEKVAMEFAGHKTRTDFDRYNIVTEGDHHRAALRVQEHLSSQAQTPSNVVQLPGRAA